MISVGAVLARLRSRGLLAGAGPVPDLPLSGISDDSRQVRAGDLYCAIRGYVHDGHEFLREAAEAGAVAALVEVPQAGLALPQIPVTDARRAASIAAQVVYGDPATGLQLVGVTGTNGKTTTVHIARHVLSRRYRSASLGTLGVVGTSGQREATQLTTPGPVEVAKRLAELKRAGAECVVIEVSSHALTQGRVEGVTFRVGVFTNLSRDHLDYHIDFAEYGATKVRLANLVASEGTLVVNADEPAWAPLAADARAVRFGLGQAEFNARQIRLGPWGSRWTLATPSAEQAVQLPLFGEFNVSNALAASGAAFALGLQLSEVADQLATVPPVAGRLEVLAERPLVLRDYAHTPDALRRALAAVRPLVRGRLIVLFGCGGDRDPGKRPLMGRAAAEGADYVLVTSDNPRREDPAAIIEDILPGLGDAPHETIVDRRRAIDRAIEMAGSDDAIVLAGKGHEVEQIIGDERRPFDEVVILRELMNARRGGR